MLVSYLRCSPVFCCSPHFIIRDPGRILVRLSCPLVPQGACQGTAKGHAGSRPAVKERVKYTGAAAPRGSGTAFFLETKKAVLIFPAQPTAEQEMGGCCTKKKVQQPLLYSSSSGIEGKNAQNSRIFGNTNKTVTVFGLAFSL